MPQRLGQHFLLDSAIIETIVEQTRPLIAKKVLEIGPGRGALTTLLAQEAKALTALELDSTIAKELALQYQKVERVKIVNVNALDFDYTQQPFDLIIGNLPYNVSSQIIVQIIESNPKVSDLVLMIQTELANRIIAKPGDKNWGRLAMLCQYNWQVANVLQVPPTAFDPPPKVQSSVLHFTRQRQQREQNKLIQLQQLARIVFAKPRKTLANNLKTLLSKEELHQLHIDGNQRPNCIDESQLLAIIDYLVDTKKSIR